MYELGKFQDESLMVDWLNEKNAEVIAINFINGWWSVVIKKARIGRPPKKLTEETLTEARAEMDKLVDVPGTGVSSRPVPNGFPLRYENGE